MPVAKTYEHMQISGEPFKENGRMYVNVIAPKGLKKVRWYSDAEYRRMYPTIVISQDFNARHAFGFREEGFITIYKGNENKIKDWAQAQWPPRAWHNLIFGYYTPGFMPITELPSDITPIHIKWDDVKVDNIHMKNYDEVTKYVMALTRDMEHNTGNFQGEINEWIQKEVKVVDKQTKENQFGRKHTYTLVDTSNNTYVWETGAKDYTCDTSISLKMKVKAHKEINGIKVTVVWYCKEM